MRIPNFTLCRNAVCASRQFCLRYRAVPSEGQSYYEFKPVAGSSRCANYLSIGPEDDVK